MHPKLWFATESFATMHTYLFVIPDVEQVYQTLIRYSRPRFVMLDVDSLYQTLIRYTSKDR